MLEGIRYGFLEELAHDAGIAFNARPISQQEVDGADELMLSSATKELLPITTYNGKPVGQGKPGPVYAALRAGSDKAIAALYRLCHHYARYSARTRSEERRVGKVCVSTCRSRTSLSL